VHVNDLTPPAGPPAEISHLVRQRTEARQRRDWARADELKAEIEAAGWRVVDRGGKTSVSPAAPASVEVDGELRYGSSTAVESRLSSPATVAWTVVVAASEDPARISRLLSGLRASAPAGTQVVVVANDPSAAQAAVLAPGAPDVEPLSGNAPEVLRTSTRLGYAAALNIALARAAGELVLLTDGTAAPAGDAFGPLAEALADGTVAAAGGFGLYSEADTPLRPGALRREPFEATEETAPGGAAPRAAAQLTTPAGFDATALEGAWLAFRRSDYIALGPLDERFVTPSWLDVWWTLRLRAGEEPQGAEYVESEPAADGDDTAERDDRDGEANDAMERPGDADVQMPRPRRAVAVRLPLDRDETTWPPDRSRLNRRNMYRILDRFGWREDLVSEP
jgi:hypothetical protein